MKILGIETSCDDTAVAVLEIKSGKIKVLSNIVSSQVKLHAKYGGVFPALAAREHAKNIDKVLALALKEAGLKSPTEVDLVAVTAGPGLAPSLLIGITFAKTLAWRYKKPIVGVNHLEGHIYSNWLKPIREFSILNSSRFHRGSSTKSGQFSNKDLFPALCLIVSGGHTELVLMKDYGKYKIIGETLDDAVGEAFDKVARLLGLGYPGGAIISKLAESGNPEKYPLPSPMLKSKNFDFSYSGLKTAVLYLLRDLNLKKIPIQVKSDLAASFQKSAIDVLVTKTIKAGKIYKPKTVFLSGGVSANKLLRQKLKDEGLKLGIPVLVPPMEYTTDNAAMIALAGYFRVTKNKNAKKSWRNIDLRADWQVS